MITGNPGSGSPLRLLVVSVLQVVLATAAAATSAINLDLHRGAPDPGNAGTPSDACAAASAQSGRWNAITILDFGPHDLADTAGETHARHVVTIGAGDDIVITVRNAVDVVDQGTVNGLQIVPGLPEPVEPATWGGAKSRYR